MRAALLPTAFLSLALLAPAPALAVDVEQLDTPSGVTVDYVKCSRNSNRCLNAASEHCKGSYQVIGSESHPGTLVSDVFAGSVTWYSMTFLCGVSDGALPGFPYQRTAEPPSTIVPPGISTVCTALGRGKSCRSQ